MSLGLVLTTVVSHLRTQLSLADRLCTVELEGQPPPELSSFPNYFLGVCGAYYQPGIENEQGRALHEVFGFKVVVSSKITYKAKTNYEEVFASDATALYTIARNVMLKLHNNYTFLGLLNTGLTNKFVTPPIWESINHEPLVKMGEWLNVDPDHDRYMEPSCLVAEVVFGKLERIQCLDGTIN